MGAAEKQEIAEFQGNLLSEKQVLVKCGGVSRKTLYVWRTEKNFPWPFNIAGGRRNFWLESDVDGWLGLNAVRSQFGRAV